MSEFPTEDMQLTTILVVADIAKAKKFYIDALGAEYHSEYGGTSLVVRLMGNWLLLVTRGEPTDDKPGVYFEPPENLNRVQQSFTIRVKDCQAAYETLKGRGVEFLTPPVDWQYEIRAFFRDPDGHLFEISEVGQSSE